MLPQLAGARGDVHLLPACCPAGERVEGVRLAYCQIVEYS
jgi:hypothetical protein